MWALQTKTIQGNDTWFETEKKLRPNLSAAEWLGRGTKSDKWLLSVLFIVRQIEVGAGFSSMWSVCFLVVPIFDMECRFITIFQRDLFKTYLTAEKMKVSLIRVHSRAFSSRREGRTWERGCCWQRNPNGATLDYENEAQNTRWRQKWTTGQYLAWNISLSLLKLPLWQYLLKCEF